MNHTPQLQQAIMRLMYEALLPFVERYKEIMEEGSTPPLKVMVEFSWIRNAAKIATRARSEVEK